MKNERKLIAHGPSSLTIAVPRQWIKKYKLQKGDSVYIEEDDKGLRILPGPAKQEKEIRIKLSSYDEQATISVLTTIYRRGYDKIIVKYDNAKQYRVISEITRHLPGLTILENSKNKCIIKSLSTELDSDFKTLFRRVFLIILQELEDLVELVDDPKELKEFYRRDADLNALVNLSVRTINKYKIQDRQKELEIYYSLLQLEEMGDDLLKFSLDVKNAKNLKPAVAACKKTMRMLYEAYFKQKYTIDDFYKQYYLYFPDYPQPKDGPEHYNLLKKLSKKGYDVFYLRSFIEKVNSLAEILLLPKVEKN